MKSRLLFGERSSNVNLTGQQQKVIQDFNQKIRSGEIQFEAISCLCGNAEFDLISDIDRYGILQDTVLCRRCGLILSNPRMTDEEYTNFYSSDLYRACYEGEEYIEIYKRQKYRLETGRHIFDEIVKFRPVTRDIIVLELGAGGGWNLLPFIKAGATAVGMDYSSSLIDLGRQYGLDMRQGGVHEIKGSYDVIILNHVLEHIPKPMEAVKKMVNHLSPDGIIYIGVPNILNFGIGQIQNAHVWYFSPRTFEYYSRLAGLKLLKSGSAEGNHMFGILESAPVSNDDDHLNELVGHYDEMLSVIRKAKAKWLIKQVLSIVRLDNSVRAVYKRLVRKR